MEAAVRIPVHLIAYTNLTRLKNALVRGELEYAPISATAYVDAWRACGCVAPLVAPRAADGSTGWYVVGLVRADAPYRQIADLQGTRLALGPEWSTAGNRLPMAAMRVQGINPQRFFAQQRLYPSALAAVRAVIADEADFAFGWASLPGAAVDEHVQGTLRHLMQVSSGDIRRPRVIWRSAPVPNAPHVVHMRVPDDIRALLLAVLAAAPTTTGIPPERSFEALTRSGFVPVTHTDFAPILAIVPEASSTGGLRPLTSPARER